MFTTRYFTHCEISIQISPSVRRGWGQVSGTLLCQLGLGRPSSWMACRYPNSLSTPLAFHWTSPYSGRKGTSHQWWVRVQLAAGQVENWSSCILCSVTVVCTFLMPPLCGANPQPKGKDSQQSAWSGRSIQRMPPPHRPS